MIEAESSSEDDNSIEDSGSHKNKQVKSNGSMVSEEDLLNRSLESEIIGEEAIEPNNYLRYASE